MPLMPSEAVLRVNISGRYQKPARNSTAGGRSRLPSTANISSPSTRTTETTTAIHPPPTTNTPRPAISTYNSGPSSCTANTATSPTASPGSQDDKRSQLQLHPKYSLTHKRLLNIATHHRHHHCHQHTPEPRNASTHPSLPTYYIGTTSYIPLPAARNANRPSRSGSTSSAVFPLSFTNRPCFGLKSSTTNNNANYTPCPA